MCVRLTNYIYIYTGWRCLKEDRVKRYCLMFSQTYLLSLSVWFGRFMAPCLYTVGSSHVTISYHGFLLFKVEIVWQTQRHKPPHII